MKKILKSLAYPISFLVNFIFKKLNIFIIYRFGNAIGDQLCMTAIVEKLYDDFSYKVIVFSSYPEFFINNPKVYKNYCLKGKNRFLAIFLRRALSTFQGENIVNFCFPVSNGGLEKYMRESKAKISLIEAHSLHFKIKLDLKNAKPKIYFSEDEIKIYEKKFEFLPKNFAIIQPIGKTTYTPNKEWGFDKFQNVVEKTKEINWVQSGLKDDLLLKDVLDLRGETKSLRELAFLISKADFVLCLEGLLNHLAAAVNTKSFVVFSGFHPVEIAKYDTTVAISKVPQVECSPCWLRENCPKEEKYCTEDILVEDVVESVV